MFRILIVISYLDGVIEMEEQFRNWNFKRKLKIKYVDAQRQVNIWEKDQQELLRQIQNIVNQYLNRNIKLTNRQLYYQLVANDIIPNAIEIYKRICKFLTDARYAGLIDWKAIEDRGRVPSMPSEWNNISELIQSATYAYRLPRWEDQDYYVELYCEKQAMESDLKPLTIKYHILFGYNKGYSSASTVYDLAKRVGAKIEEGKKVMILYVGDHDPSGLDMIRDIKDRVNEFLTEGKQYIEPNYEVKQLALNMKQINKYKPPPNPAKITDPRAKWYIKEFGNKSWELEALKPEVLIKIVEKGINEFIDIEKYNAWMDQETKEKKALEKFGHKLTRKK